MSKLVKIEDLDVNLNNIASICEHTFLKTVDAFSERAKIEKKSAIELRRTEFKKFISQGAKNFPTLYGFCVRPEDVKYAQYINSPQILKNREPMKIVSVIGYPDSWENTNTKMKDAELAIRHRADEIDMVMNYRCLKIRKFKDVEKDIEAITELCHEYEMPIKVILETSELSELEIMTACQICEDNNVDFVKTSTGYGAYGATKEDVELIKNHFSRGLKISGNVLADNVAELLYAASGRKDGYIDLDPNKIRIGESKLLNQLRYN